MTGPDEGGDPEAAERAAERAVAEARAKLVALIRGGERFLVTCHLRPDADALGSALGLTAILRALGKEVELFTADAPPRNLRFLLRGGEVARAFSGGPWDATFVTDAAAAALVPALPPRDRSGPVVMIDHHSAHDDFGDLVLRDARACATGVVVLELMEALGLARIPDEAAEPLYAAIVADTGGFRYPGTGPSTLRLGARLLEHGIDPWEVASHLFERWSLARMALLGRLLRDLRLELGGEVARLAVDRATLEELGADDEMVEGMVNYARKVEGVRVALLLWEQVDGEGTLRIRVSLRSQGEVDVARIARALGGGGHRSAAGALVEGTIEGVWEKARGPIEAALRGAPPSSET